MGYDLDTIDREMIGLLQRDGRMSNVEIARRIGVSEATVRKRLERLVSEKVIRITAVPAADKVGLSVNAFFTFDVDLSRIDRVADELAKLPEVRAVYYTTGETDLIVEAWFASSDALLRFLTHHVAAIPGIKRTATSHILRTIKDCSRWVLPPTAPPRILVVDDDPDFVEVTRLALVTEGFEVSSASNGEEALASMRVIKPDLIILDIMMQGVLDGLRTGQEIRSNGDLRTVPILMVSSITKSSFAGLLPGGKDLPADNFLEKPVDPPLLVAEVRRLMRFS
jgi:Lrp/AsnC family transcriptional regulator for asnA, asnC and gidA